VIRARLLRRCCGASPVSPASQYELGIKRRRLQQARHLGPSVCLLVQALWTDAIEETARDVLQHLLRIASRYGASRLEAACRRACFYHRTSNCFTFEWILEKGYDRVAQDPFTDIRGQFVFPDIASNDVPMSDVSIGDDGANILSVHPTVPGSASVCQSSVQSRNACKIMPDYRET